MVSAQFRPPKAEIPPQEAPQRTVTNHIQSLRINRQSMGIDRMGFVASRGNGFSGAPLGL